MFEGFIIYIYMYVYIYICYFIYIYTYVYIYIYVYMWLYNYIYIYYIIYILSYIYIYIIYYHIYIYYILSYIHILNVLIMFPLTSHWSMARTSPSLVLGIRFFNVFSWRASRHLLRFSKHDGRNPATKIERLETLWNFVK